MDDCSRTTRTRRPMLVTSDDELSSQQFCLVGRGVSFYRTGFATARVESFSAACIYWVWCALRESHLGSKLSRCFNIVAMQSSISAWTWWTSAQNGLLQRLYASTHTCSKQGLHTRYRIMWFLSARMPPRVDGWRVRANIQGAMLPIAACILCCKFAEML